MSDTLETADEFCGNAELRSSQGEANSIHECLGHDLSAVVAGGSAVVISSDERQGEDVHGPSVEFGPKPPSDYWEFYPKE